MITLGPDVRFEGHFDKCFSQLKETQQQELLRWVVACNEHKTNPILSKRQRDLIGFVLRIGSNLRALLTKQKGGYFLAIFLDKHKYYEDEMQRLGF